MPTDLITIFNWWFLFLGLGFIFLPTAAKIFAKFADSGYIFAKILGVAVLSYLVFLLGSFEILPFRPEAVWSLLIVLAVFNYFSFLRSLFKKILVSFFSLTSDSCFTLKLPPAPWAIFVFEEILFFLALFFWAWVRSHEPAIDGLEKFMDFSFINSILRSEFFPPRDLWLTPETINYYYFGHLITAVLTKLSGIPPEVTFNLMMATLFALTFVGAFSIGLNLFRSNSKHETLNSKPHFAKASRSRQFAVPFRSLDEGGFRISDLGFRDLTVGLLSAFLVTLGGNLHTFYAFIRGFEKYWYPDATRFIPYTIHEFPAYSWVVSDLHGHVLDIPFVLLTIALLLSLIFNFQDKLYSQHHSKLPGHSERSEESRFFGLWPQNDKGKSILLQILLISFLLAVMYMTNAWDGLIYLVLASLVFFWLSFRQFGLSGNLIKGVATQYLILYPLFFLFALPFTLNFKPFVSGIGLVHDHSPFYMLGILWGFFYFLAVSFFLFLWKAMKQWSNLTISDVFVLLLIFLSTLLLIFPEIAYVKDIYPLHYRANTMFKLGYQAFIMLSISSAYIVFRLLSALKPRRLPFFIFLFSFLILFVPVAIYPYFAIKSYYGSLKNYQGLNGMLWLQKKYPSDYQALLWLKGNIRGQPIILEAVGESYTDFARVSSFTGLPTVIGWPVHEWLWRGSYDEAGIRDAEVGIAYDTTSLEKTKEFLKKYQVKYVFVGALERQKYPQANFEKWGKLGKMIFQSNYTQVYEVSL